MWADRKGLTLLSEEKYINTEGMPKKYNLCYMWTHKKDTPEYINQKEENTSSIKHVESAGSMEVVGMRGILCRSVRLYGLRYTFLHW